jgi:DNA-binding transcriptional regulator LsrR (DeoR family)
MVKSSGRLTKGGRTRPVPSQSAPPEKRSRKRLTPDEKVEIVLERFGGFKDRGKPIEISKLAKERKRDPAVISRAIISAFCDGLVEVRKIPDLPVEPQRMSNLEAAMSEKFPQLLSAIVIDAEGTSDYVHQLLGKAMAKLIAFGTVFRDDDVICVGSGRGVYYALEPLGGLPPLRAKGVTLMSLTGTAYPRFHDKTAHLRLDADFNTNLFARAFADEVTMRLTSHRIAYEDPKLLISLKRTSCLGPDRWKSISPAHALVGVGVLSSGHRFYDACTDPVDNTEGMLAPIHAALTELIHLLERDKEILRDFCPVADIAHHLFYVPLPKEVDAKIPMETKEAIQRLIAKINDQLFTVTEEQLKTIKTIMLVAGTKRKALAIKELLLNESYNIRFLCTDRAAADEILRSRG